MKAARSVCNRAENKTRLVFYTQVSINPISIGFVSIGVPPTYYKQNLKHIPRICILTPEKRTKLFEGQIFTSLDRQDSCVPSVVRFASHGDQEKGKVGPQKILFFQK